MQITYAKLQFANALQRKYSRVVKGRIASLNHFSAGGNKSESSGFTKTYQHVVENVPFTNISIAGKLSVYAETTRFVGLRTNFQR